MARTPRRESRYSLLVDPTTAVAIWLAVIAALLAFVFGQVTEWLKNRRDFRHRWDEAVYTTAQEFVAATRRLSHLAEAKSTTDAELSEAHARVRTTCQQLIVIADTDLARKARLVQREAYALVKTARAEADPRPAEKSARARYFVSINEFYDALRANLKLSPHPSPLIED